MKQARGAAVGVISLGCPKNLVDTEVMLGLLRQAGFALVGDPSQADILIVNTCCFIEDARTEAAEAIEEALAWRRTRRAKALLVAGCWPQRDAEGLRGRYPEIDALLGPGDVPQVVEIVNGALAGSGAAAPGAPPDRFLYDDTMPRLRTTPPWTAYLKIADGCGHRCRFCLIPHLRGPYRSRGLDSVVAEATRLAADGVRELNLVAQDTTAYGTDTKEADLAELLTRLAAIPELYWIRTLYAYPSRVTPRLIETMAAQAKVCQYVDIPLQHADGAILRSMGRPGDGAEYLKLIGRLREAMPEVAIRSAFILGYPGEGDEEFARLLEFVEAAQLDRAGAFIYSQEEGTPAAALEPQVPREVAEQRRHELMVLQQGLSLARNRRWVGREIEVLIEGQGEGHTWVGRSFRDAPEIDGLVIVRPGAKRLAPGQFLRAKVTNAQPYDLLARPA
jgi:ribosomal protein S12 methylthiotransferase